MTNEKIVYYSDMLDIIFAHRNKAYGAYQLRRSYHQYLMRAFGVGLFTIVLLFTLPRLLNTLSANLIEKPEETIVMMSTPDLTPEPPPIPPPTPPTPPPPVRATFVYLPPLIVEDDKASDPPKEDITDLLDKTGEVGKVDQAGDPNALPTIQKTDTTDWVENPKPVEPDITYTPIDIQKMPSFPGGDAELMQFLHDNINYPAMARENNIQGTVALSFIVGKDGSISGIQILKEPGGGCGKEALRVLGLMPKWTPGEAQGNPVKVKFTLPVKFKLM